MVCLVMAVLATSVFAAETSVKGTIYSTWTMNYSDGADHANAFSIDRAYFGAESKLSDYTSVRITFDIRPEMFGTAATKVVDTEGDTVSIPAMSAYSGYPIILKYAYADWKIKPIPQILKVRLGLQPTMYLNYADGLWNRRYIAKNITDQNSWTSTADLGASVNASLGPQGNFGEIGVSIFNGTKYSDITDKNKNKDINPYLKLTPFYNSGDFNQVAFFAQYYTGTQNVAITGTTKASDWKNNIVSVGGKLAYQKTVDLCFDVDFNTLGQGTGKADLKRSAYSIFGNVYLSPIVPSTSLFKNLILFGRVDAYDPNTDKADDGNTMIIAGIECAPVKGVRASIDYRHVGYQDDSKVAQKFLYLNTEFKF
jgi:hypothetical protein